MPRLSEDQRLQAIGMLIVGRSQGEVAGIFQVNRSTIHRLRVRFQATGSTRDRQRPGQPRVTTPGQDRIIRIIHLRDRFRSTVQTARETPGRNNQRICTATVRRRLREHGIRAHRAYVGPVLNDLRRRNRRKWAINHTHPQWPRVTWNRVVFSDESRFKLFRNDARHMVYRRVGERFNQNCVHEVDQFGGGSVMVWGAIRFGWKSQLLIIDGNMTADRYLQTVLSAQVFPYFNLNPNAIFMHDNARPHVAGICRNALQTNNVDVLDWPPYSADCNPIEHLWDMLDRKVRARTPAPTTHAQLRHALIQEWHRIPQWRVNRLVSSMSRRVQAVIRERGAHTRY